MVKKILYITLAFLLLAYILYAVSFPRNHLDGKNCNGVEVIIADTLKRHFIAGKDVLSMLKNAGLYPQGKPLKDIRTDLMEQKLEENKLIKKAQVYITAGGGVTVKVYQKIPLLRVMSVSGDYYVDTEGDIMPVTLQYAAYVPLVTGFVDKEFARKELSNLARFLQKNKFWDAQIEQIYVYPNKDLELTPRVGNHQILLGRIDQFEEKLENLRLFYEQALDKTGWNRYSMINLKFKNQIVCTKR